jgi:hypothetical protein
VRLHSELDGPINQVYLSGSAHRCFDIVPYLPVSLRTFRQRSLAYRKIVITTTSMIQKRVRQVPLHRTSRKG